MAEPKPVNKKPETVNAMPVRKEPALTRVRFKLKTSCEIDGKLQPVDEGQEAAILPHLADHLVANNLAEKI